MVLVFGLWFPNLQSSNQNIKIEEYQTKFREAINDDLNTSKAMAVMFEMLKSNIPSEDKYDLAISFDEILGLRLKWKQLYTLILS